MQSGNIIRLTGVLAAVVLFFSAACPKRNHAPVFTSFNAVPADTVVPTGSLVTLTVAASDEDNDELAFTWSATDGTVSATTGDSVVWTAAESLRVCTLAVTCSNGKAETDSSRSIRVRAWHEGGVEMGMFTSTPVPANGTAVDTFDLTDDFPAGSVITVAKVSVEFEPDTLNGAYAQVWVTGASGDEVKIWDRRAEHLVIHEFILDEFAGKTPKCTWYLKVTRDDPFGPDGIVKKFGLKVYYRF